MFSYCLSEPFPQPLPLNSKGRGRNIHDIMNLCPPLICLRGGSGRGLEDTYRRIFLTLIFNTDSHIILLYLPCFLCLNKLLMNQKLKLPNKEIRVARPVWLSRFVLLPVVSSIPILIVSMG